MGHRNREVAERIRDLIRRIAVSVAKVLAEKSDRLLPFKDANRQWKPSQIVPVKVACCGDEGPYSVAFRGNISQVIEILRVVEDEKAVRRIS